MNTPRSWNATLLPLNSFALTTEEFKKGADRIVSHLMTSRSAFYPAHKALRFRLEKVDSVSSVFHTQIDPVYSEAGLELVLKYDHAVEQAPELLIKDVLVLTHIAQGQVKSDDIDIERTAILTENIRSPNSWSELKQNARNGDPIAVARNLAIEFAIFTPSRTASALNVLQGIFGPLPGAPAHIDFGRAHLEQASKKAKAIAQKHEAKIRKEFHAWAAADQERIRYEGMDEKLNDLILKNDRRGVRKMIDAYLPWSLMSSSESRAWKIWLEAIENPNRDNAILAFRGVNYDTDKVQRLLLPNGEERIGFLS